MLPSTDSIQFAFEKSSTVDIWDFCNIFYKIFYKIFCIETILNLQFRVPVFHSCKIPSSNFNATLYTITSIIQDPTWNVSRFQTFSTAWSIFFGRKCAKFWHVRDHIFWCMFFISSTNSELVDVLLASMYALLVYLLMWLPDCATLWNDLHQQLPNLVDQMSRFPFYKLWF